MLHRNCWVVFPVMVWCQQEVKIRGALATGDMASYCHLSTSSVFSWIQEGHLLAYAIPGGHHRIVPREFGAFLVRNRMPIDEAYLAGADGERRILAVYDEPQVAGAISRALNQDHHRSQIASASDGFRAGLFVASFQPLLVITCPTMPGIDGSQMGDLVRTDPDPAHTRTLVVTGIAEPRIAKRILSLGADECVEKPPDIDEFVQRSANFSALNTSY
jgi:CheY-like chemotaxis protein